MVADATINEHSPPFEDFNEALPIELRSLHRFCLWGVDPRNPKRPAVWSEDQYTFSYKNWNDDDWLTSLEVTWQRASQFDYRIGLVVPDGWAIFDIDNVRDPYTRKIKPEVEELIRRLNTVVWISSSGQGLHVFVRLRPHGDLPDRTKFTNLAYSGGTKTSEIKKPNTFVALTFEPLPGYSADEKQVQLLAEDVEHSLLGSENVATFPPSARTSETAYAEHRHTLERSSRFIRERFFKGYTNGGYIWRLLRFNGNQTKPFMDDPSKLTDHSQWNILLLSDYFRRVPDANHKDALELSKAFERHWLKYSPHDRGHCVKPDSWHKNQAATQCDYAKEIAREKRSKIDYPDEVVTALLKIVQETSNPLLTKNEVLFLNAVARQIQQNGNTSVKISIRDMATLTQICPSAVSSAKNAIINRSFSWLEIGREGKTATYRVVLE